MEAQATEEILRFFRDVPDPRAGNAWHPLSDVMTLAILAVFCGARGWADVEFWAHNHKPWLATFLRLPHGIPTHDTFDRVFASIDPLAFERCFMSWTATLVASGKKLIAIDGKTLRASFEHGWSRTPIHMVSAFVSDNRLVLGQLKVDNKANEIVAIPQLLALLDLNGATVTIDGAGLRPRTAMGCQKQIAQQILDQKGNYILAVKENQPTLRERIVDSFNEARLEKFAGWTHDYAEGIGSGHGRIEKRQLWVTTDIAHLAVAKDWPGLRCIVMIESTRQLRETTTTETRYFIASHKKLDAKFMARAIRGHWGIENSLHHVLDVSMGEDECRLRKKHGAENFSRLRRIALNKLRPIVIRNDHGTDMKASVKVKQKICGWNPNFLLSALLH
jgi:predicted transposase YbfD/YdcC